jgi:predicted nucleic acid-binding protein
VKLLDTTVAIDYLRGLEQARDVVDRLALREPILSSEVVRFEILAGARVDELGAIERFCSALAWLPVDAEVSRTAGALARRYRASFSGIDGADYLIAASAIVASADLLTTSTRHYPMFAALEPPY